ncbi:hypothetical protein Hanom_Chr07g00665761 [Helianthus anomalus]
MKNKSSKVANASLLALAYKLSKRKTVDTLQSLLSTHCSFQQKCKDDHGEEEYQHVF